MAEANVENRRFGNIQKPPENRYDDKRNVTVYKHRQFEIVEVEKEKIDNIKHAVDNAKNNINKGATFRDVILGLSTTLFGCFIGCVPNVIEMAMSKKLSSIVFFYFGLLLAAVILFSIYLGSQRKNRTATSSLIETIIQETDSISNSWVLPDNELPGYAPSNNLK